MKMNYVVEVLRCKNGVRIPLMLNAKTQMPHGWAMDYSLAKHLGKPINTAMVSARAVAMFHSWADDRKINIDERFGSGNLFTTFEMNALSEFLWTAWTRGSANKRGSEATGKLVSALTHESRVNAVKNYIEWRSSVVSSAMEITDPIVALVGLRLESNVDELKTSRRKGRSKERGYLTEKQCERLFEIVRPGSSENPFQKKCQNRNYFLFLFYYELGARRAEPLVLKSSHINLGPKSNITVTYTPDDSKDQRTTQPSVKTLSRTLPISRDLARATEAMLKDRMHNKKMNFGAKRTPFVVLNTDKGAPLSISSVDRMFNVIRVKFPLDFPKDFGPHHLRRSWNYRFSKACQAEEIEKKMADMMKRYLMGWTKTSQQVEKYNGQFIEEMAVQLMLKAQDKLVPQ